MSRLTRCAASSRTSAIGIIRSEGTNNRLYYEVNQKYQFYAPLRAIFTNIDGEAEPELQDAREDTDLVKKLRATGNVQLAFETGAFVRDHASGTDLFIMGDVNRARVAKLVTEMEQELGREINYTVMTESRSTAIGNASTTAFWQAYSVPKRLFWLMSAMPV